MARVRVQVPIDQSKPQVAAAEPGPAPIIPHGLLTRDNLIKLVFIGLVLFVIFTLMNDRKELKNKVDELSTSQTAASPNNAQKYQEEIGKIVELPTGQTPSLIPVTDAKKLASENTFFKNAQDGDVVLLYVSQDKSVRAILYRPSTHKVVEATSSATIGSGTAAPKQ